eukprot:SAG31_NODE_31041_length_373_cov_0.693431_1_plen_89_part_01
MLQHTVIVSRLFSTILLLTVATCVLAIPSSIDRDGNVYVEGYPNIIMRPQAGTVGIGGESNVNVAVSVDGDVAFDGGVRIVHAEGNCDG